MEELKPNGFYWAKLYKGSSWEPVQYIDSDMGFVMLASDLYISIDKIYQVGPEIICPLTEKGDSNELV